MNKTTKENYELVSWWFAWGFFIVGFYILGKAILYGALFDGWFMLVLGLFFWNCHKKFSKELESCASQKKT
jgi:hypothetical protein